MRGVIVFVFVDASGQSIRVEKIERNGGFLVGELCIFAVITTPTRIRGRQALMRHLLFGGRSRLALAMRHVYKENGAAITGRIRRILQ